MIPHPFLPNPHRERFKRLPVSLSWSILCFLKITLEAGEFKKTEIYSPQFWRLPDPRQSNSNLGLHRAANSWAKSSVNTGEKAPFQEAFHEASHPTPSGSSLV